MKLDIVKIEYYNVIIDGYAEEGFKMLSRFADAGINLLAFKTVHIEPMRTQFSLSPADSAKMIACAENAGINIDGPHYALLIKGYNDKSGSLADIFEKLSRAHIHVSDSSGIANIKDSYGVILHLNQKDCENAISVLKS